MTQKNLLNNYKPETITEEENVHLQVLFTYENYLYSMWVI